MSKLMIPQAKLLAKLLRHSLIDEGFKVTDQGFADVDKVIIWINQKWLGNHPPIDKDILHDIVKEDNKGRFQLSHDSKQIRAIQGHSFKLKVSYPIYHVTGTPIHCTYRKHIDSIKKYGLKRMDRQYIHMIEIFNNDNDPWHLVRKNCNWVVVIKANQVQQYKFHKTDNDVLLCDADVIDPDDLLIIKRDLLITSIF